MIKSIQVFILLRDNSQITDKSTVWALLCPTEESCLLISSLYVKINALHAGSVARGVRENAGGARQLALSKGPECL
jgi:hypothetical protein